MRRFRLSPLPLILECVAVSNPSRVPNPPWPSAEVWVKVGPDQDHPDELHGTEEDGDGMFLGQSLCIPRDLSPSAVTFPEQLCHLGAITYGSLPIPPSLWAAVY